MFDRYWALAGPAYMLFAGVFCAAVLCAWQLPDHPHLCTQPPPSPVGIQSNNNGCEKGESQGIYMCVPELLVLNSILPSFQTATAVRCLITFQ